MMLESSRNFVGLPSETAAIEALETFINTEVPATPTMIKDFHCDLHDENPWPGVIECHGVVCSFCISEGSPNNACMYFPCGKDIESSFHVIG